MTDQTQPVAPTQPAPANPPKARATGRPFGQWGLLTVAFVIVLSVLGYWIALSSENAVLGHIRVQYILVMIVLLGLCVIAGQIVCGRIDGILIDELNRISLSRAQWAMWFILIIGGYFAEALWNVANSFPIPIIQQDLLVLLGISSGSAVMSSIINQSKKANDSDAVQSAADAAPAKPTGAPPDNHGALDCNVDAKDASWAELYLGDEAADRSTVDISRLQQLVITLLLGITFVTLQWQTLVAAAKDTGLAMPTFDKNSSFLWLLGLSHAAYIAYKAPTHTSTPP